MKIIEKIGMYNMIYIVNNLADIVYQHVHLFIHSSGSWWSHLESIPRTLGSRHLYNKDGTPVYYRAQNVQRMKMNKILQFTIIDDRQKILVARSPKCNKEQFSCLHCT